MQGDLLNSAGDKAQSRDAEWKRFARIAHRRLRGKGQDFANSPGYLRRIGHGDLAVFAHHRLRKVIGQRSDQLIVAWSKRDSALGAKAILPRDCGLAVRNRVLKLLNLLVDRLAVECEH